MGSGASAGKKGSFMSRRLSGEKTAPAPEAAPEEVDYLSPLDQYECAKKNRRGSRLMDSIDPVYVSENTATQPTKSSAEALQHKAEAEMGGQHTKGGRNSQVCFAEKLHCSMVLDWDDTLFPTTWIREDCQLDWRQSLEEQLEPGQCQDTIHSLLEKHLMVVMDFLNDAVSVANIFIVTLAKRPWVEISMKKFMPALQEIIDMHSLQVIYAQEYADPKEVDAFMRDRRKTPEEGMAFWTGVKRTAIAQELDKFHNMFEISWKNVISLGDSDFERYGTLEAVQDYMKREMSAESIKQEGHTHEGISKDGKTKRLRVKTVKMLDQPTVVELSAQLKLLRRWLPHMVNRDAGFDVEIAGTDDDDKLKELHKQMTDEEDPELSWQDLAGMNNMQSEQPADN